MKKLVRYRYCKKWTYGFWDGEKATLITKGDTIVRKKEWLEFLACGSFIFYLYTLLCLVPFLIIKVRLVRWWKIKTGKLIPLDRL